MFCPKLTNWLQYFNTLKSYFVLHSTTQLPYRCINENGLQLFEFIKQLKEIPEGDGEKFTYTTIEKLRNEFIDTVRDQSEPMVYGGDRF